MKNRSGLTLCLMSIFLLFSFVDPEYSIAEGGVAANQTSAHNQMQQMRERALKGDPEAQHNLGMIAFFGFKGGAKDYSEAMEWYTKAAAQNYPQAIVQIGALYEHGLGVAADLTKAAEFYQKAADLNWAPGMMHLGLMYLRGVQEGKSSEDGMAMLQKSCDNGHQTACGLILYYDRKDEEALSVFQEQCQKGDYVACNMFTQVKMEMPTVPAEPLPPPAEQPTVDEDLPEQNNTVILYLVLAMAVLIGAATVLFIFRRRSKKQD